MTEPQLNLLGDHAQPADAELGPTQRECMRVLRDLGSLTRDEAGAIGHERRGKHTREQRCMFCGPDGAHILKALATRRLIERDHVTGDARLPLLAPNRTATAIRSRSASDEDPLRRLPQGL